MTNAQVEPDFTERMQRSLLMLELSRKCHQAATRCARAEAAVAEWPESLTWRQERIAASDAWDHYSGAYDAMLSSTPWVDWGLASPEGP